MVFKNGIRPDGGAYLQVKAEAIAGVGKQAEGLPASSRGARGAPGDGGHVAGECFDVQTHPIRAGLFAF